MRSLPAFVGLDLLWWTGLIKLKASHIFHLKVISLKYIYAGCSGKRKLYLQCGNPLQKKDSTLYDEFSLFQQAYFLAVVIKKT